jgi:membrane-associated protein
MAQTVIQALTHINTFLAGFVHQYGALVYVLMFAIVFAETGVVVFPWLPGDTLLFAAGALAALPAGNGSTVLSLPIVLVVFFVAAFCGDNCNYWIGHYIGPKALDRDGKVIKRKYLDQTQGYFDRYGARTVIIARFVPFVRTFAPFMAGVGRMRYSRFISFSAAGTILWVGIFVSLGYFFGNISFVADHFELAVVAVLLISAAPAIFEFTRHKLESRRKARERVDAALAEAAAEVAEREV